MLEEFGANIWTAAGPVVEGQAGFRFPTRMVVMRLASGGLLVWSPVALNGDLAREVDGLGPVAHILAPNLLHHSFLAEWQALYPAATVWGLPELAARRPDVRFGGAVGDTPLPWEPELAHVVVRGNAISSEIVLFHRPSRTAIFCDLLQQFPPGWFTGWRAVIARLDLMVSPEPAVPRKFRLAFTDRALARTAIVQVLDWPAERVIMAHGAPVTSDVPAFLRRAFRWLVT